VVRYIPCLKVLEACFLVLFLAGEFVIGEEGTVRVGNKIVAWMAKGIVGRLLHEDAIDVGDDTG
jgi:hypothetical protein